MSLDHILLGLLRQPACGYDLKKVFDEGIGHFWAAELSQIYPALKRLEKKGWLRGHDAASKRGPGRRVYETSAEGRRALVQWLSGEPQVGDTRFTYLAQLCLMDELCDLRQTVRFLMQLRDRFAQKLEKCRSIERRWAESDARYPGALPISGLHAQLTLRLGLLSLACRVKWCDESIGRLKSRLKREESHSGLSPVSKTSHRRGRRGPRAVLDRTPAGQRR